MVTPYSESCRLKKLCKSHQKSWCPRDILPGFYLATLIQPVVYSPNIMGSNTCV